MEDNKSAMHQGFAGKAGEFLVGNDLRVTRLGFGSIPGTSSVKHLEENLAAAGLKIDENKMQELAHAAHG